MAKAMGRDILPEVKMPRKRSVRPKGLKYNNPEAQLRKDIIKALRRHSVRIYRIENSICGKSSGIPDLLVFSDKMYFIELKSAKGRLQENQVEFQRLCQLADINHIVCRSEEDIKKVWEGA